LPIVSVKEARKVAGEVLRRAGAPAANADLQRDLLIEAELRGLASHGLLRLPRIIERIANGVADPRTSGRHEWRAPGFLQVDGQMGLGPVVAMKAIEVARRRAREHGVAVAAISNSNHIGMLAFYAEHVAADGQIMIALSTSEALVHPWGGRRAMIGTNPIAFGIPTETGPYIADTATGHVAMGKIHDHANRDEPIPLGWALDIDGNPTTDPHRAKKGAIAPFGGAKGYALGLSFELLVSALTGAALGRDVRGTLDSTDICNKGDVFIIIDSPGAGLAAYLDLLRAEPPAEGFDAVRLPEERSQASRQRNLENGLEIPNEIWARINHLAFGKDHKNEE